MNESEAENKTSAAVRQLISLFEKNITKKAPSSAVPPTDVRKIIPGPNGLTNREVTTTPFSYRERPHSVSSSSIPICETFETGVIASLNDKISVKTLIYNFQNMNNAPPKASHHLGPALSRRKPCSSSSVDSGDLRGDGEQQRQGGHFELKASSFDSSSVGTDGRGFPTPQKDNTQLLSKRHDLIRDEDPYVRSLHNREDHGTQPTDDQSLQHQSLSSHRICSATDSTHAAAATTLDLSRSYCVTPGLTDIDNRVEDQAASLENSDDGDDEDDQSNGGVSPLPASYQVLSSTRGHLDIVLPPPPSRSLLKGAGSKHTRRVNILEGPTMVVETYNTFEYTRGDEDLDPIAASAQYEIEKKTENLEKLEVTLHKDSKGLGLSIVGVGLGSDSGEERLGIFIKALAQGGVAEVEGSLRVHDQLLEIDGVSLVGVSQKFAGETLRKTAQVVKFLIGRDNSQSKLSS